MFFSAEKLVSEDARTMADVKSMVYQLYSTLHVEQHQLEKEKELRAELENLQVEIEPLEKVKYRGNLMGKGYHLHSRIISAVPSKNAVSANIKHSRYFQYTFNFCSFHYCGKRLYVHQGHYLTV